MLHAIGRLVRGFFQRRLWMESHLHEDPACDTVAPSDAILCSYPEQQTSKTDTITNIRLPGNARACTYLANESLQGSEGTNQFTKPPLQMISKLADHAMSGLEVRYPNYCIHANPGLAEGTTLARFK